MTSSDIYVFKVFVLVTHVTPRNIYAYQALVDLNSEEQKGEQN